MIAAAREISVGYRAPVLGRDPSSWPALSRRELFAHLEANGLSRSTPDPIAALRRSELGRGKAIDPRVTAKQLDQLVALSRDAERLVPKRQNLFFGFTRMIDAKFDLTPKLLQALIDRVLDDDPSLTPAAFARMIEEGPGGKQLIWTRPETPAQLVASLVRQPWHSKATSVPINISEGIASWIADALEKAGRPLRLALGGAAAFGASLAAVMNQLAKQDGKDVLGVDFYAWDHHAPAIGELFGPGVHMVDRNGDRCPPDARVDPGQAPRRNYIGAFPPPRAFELQVGTRKLRIDPTAEGGRFVLSTPSSQSTTFGDITPEALKKIAERHDTFFFSGLHYQTKALDELDTFAKQLDFIRGLCPGAVIHYEYAKPKAPENEHLLMRALAGRISSMSLNPGPELASLLANLQDAKMISSDLPTDLTAEQAEDPAFMIEAANTLMDCLKLKRIHLHAMAGDLLVIDGAKDPKRQVLSLLRARQMVTMKAANATGEIKFVRGRRRDVWPVHHTFPGENLAAEHAFADAMKARFSLSDEARDQIVERCYFRDPKTDRLYVFVPSRGLRDKRGGTISAGDTIDLVALILGREEAGASAQEPRRPSRRMI